MAVWSKLKFQIPNLNTIVFVECSSPHHFQNQNENKMTIARPTIAVACFLIFTSTGYSQQKFELNVPSDPSLKSQATINGDRITIESGGSSFTYVRTKVLDSLDGKFHAYFSVAARQFVRFPASGSGKMFIGQKRGLTVDWRESKMIVKKSTTATTGNPKPSSTGSTTTGSSTGTTTGTGSGTSSGMPVAPILFGMIEVEKGGFFVTEYKPITETVREQYQVKVNYLEQLSDKSTVTKTRLETRARDIERVRMQANRYAVPDKAISFSTSTGKPVSDINVVRRMLQTKARPAAIKFDSSPIGAYYQKVIDPNLVIVQIDPSKMPTLKR